MGNIKEKFDNLEPYQQEVIEYLINELLIRKRLSEKLGKYIADITKASPID